jgi:signal transduction histidine kinase/AraC-like DNA-binding protein/CheY-like chemotaxis protein
MKRLIVCRLFYTAVNTLYIACIILSLGSCNYAKKEKKYNIGFSQCTFGDVWRKTMQQEVERELSFHPEINLIVKDANLSSQKQIEQINELINQKVDLLIVCPSEAEPVTPVVDLAYAKGIPVILVDRNTVSKNYTAFIGASNYKVGLDAGAYTNALLKGKGTVLELSGPDIGSSADIGRHTGFTDFIKKFPGIKYVNRLSVDWDHFPDEATKKITDLLATPNDIELIFAQNDRLAFVASNVCKKLGIDQKIKIIGVDGLPGKNGGIDLVEKGILKATILYPTGGKEAIQTAANILENKPHTKENVLATTIIDSTNVRIMRLQNEKLQALQDDIDRNEQRINEQKIIERNQNNIIYTISVSLALALISGSILFYYLRENKKINSRLALQNEEILLQRNQLIELGKKAKEATEAKINFFTNISHEFRTPLTLIIAPLEELMAGTKMNFAAKQDLALIRKNVIRLLRLINELIDFRKIDTDKMKLQCSENDLVSFTSEIAETFKPLAKKRHIDLKLVSNERSIAAWFDSSMLDKVLFNLLSNALKFTRDNGSIHITIEKNIIGNYAIIKVEDNGIGMSAEVAAHAFELFYQGNITSQQGSGLGLSLSKELINLHHGQITVNSKQGNGTCFEIRLPLGTSHLENNEMIAEKKLPAGIMYHEERFYSTEPAYENGKEPETDGVPVKKEHSILIIEDNPDLCIYLAEKLGKEYEILVSDNGNTAVQQAFDNVPDLIISDIVLPGKDGVSITHTLKNDFRTSHIPIILLTAKNAIEEKIEGMKSMADAYIVKPFNLQLLEETIKSLKKNREILRGHYTSELPIEIKSQTPKKLDRKFINEFTMIVESNIGNENFTIDDICTRMGISRIQLYRKVKALLGYNVNDYILHTRLQKAKYYLNEGELSISEIAFKVGFASAAYFSTVFKAKFAATPSEYKEKIK